VRWAAAQTCTLASLTLTLSPWPAVRTGERSRGYGRAGAGDRRDHRRQPARGAARGAWPSAASTGSTTPGTAISGATARCRMPRLRPRLRAHPRLRHRPSQRPRRDPVPKDAGECEVLISATLVLAFAFAGEGPTHLGKIHRTELVIPPAPTRHAEFFSCSLSAAGLRLSAFHAFSIVHRRMYRSPSSSATYSFSTPRIP